MTKELKINTLYVARYVIANSTEIISVYMMIRDWKNENGKIVLDMLPERYLKDSEKVPTIAREEIDLIGPETKLEEVTDPILKWQIEEYFRQ
jgi:hypothetical protein